MRIRTTIASAALLSFGAGAASRRLGYKEH